jgi:hypothetical protein
MLVTNAQGIEIFTNVFNMIRCKREFPKECKTALIQPIYKVHRIRRALGYYTGNSLLPVMAKIYPGTIACRLRYWLTHH